MNKLNVHLDSTRHDSHSDKTELIEWRNLNAALTSAFGVKSYETIISIEVSEVGITAKIGLIKDDTDDE